MKEMNHEGDLSRKEHGECWKTAHAAYLSVLLESTWIVGTSKLRLRSHSNQSHEK